MFCWIVRRVCISCDDDDIMTLILPFHFSNWQSSFRYPNSVGHALVDRQSGKGALDAPSHSRSRLKWKQLRRAVNAVGDNGVLAVEKKKGLVGFSVWLKALFAIIIQARNATSTGEVLTVVFCVVCWSIVPIIIRTKSCAVMVQDQKKLLKKLIWCPVVLLHFFFSRHKNFSGEL